MNYSLSRVVLLVAISVSAMYVLQYILALFMAAPVWSARPASAGSATFSPPPFLNITAISAENNRSTIECWQLAAPSTAPSTPGIVGSTVTSLGPAGNLSYTILPPHFDGGLHNAPVVQ